MTAARDFEAAGAGGPGSANANARLEQLVHVTAELAAARTLDDLVDTVVKHASEAIEASVATLSLLESDGTTLSLLGIRGDAGGISRRWSTHSIDDLVPEAETARTGRSIMVVGRHEIERRYPALIGQIPDERSLLCLPLMVGTRCLGVIGLLFPGAAVPSAVEQLFLTVFADTCAQALARLRAVEQASGAEARLAFLVAASGELSRSLDYELTLSNVARLAVPTLADWCAIDIVEDGLPRTLAVAHVDPAKVALAREFQKRYPTDPEAPTGPAQVVRTGRSEFYPEITDELIEAGARDAEHLAVIRELRPRSAIIVPLAVRGRVLGAITLVRAESDHRYLADDLTFAEELARRAAMAIDNARVHTEMRTAAAELTRAVLPDRLTSAPGWEVGAYYSPSGRGEVGGDFYDAIGLPDGTAVALIGDVSGRGVDAAAAMAQMHSALRASIAIDPDPVAVIGTLDRMFALYVIDQLVTLLYLRLDPRHGTVEIVSAGHLPPLLLSPGERVRVLPVRPSVPIGVRGGGRASTSFRLPPGCGLLLYTDGLVERRGEGLDDGIDRLLHTTELFGSATFVKALPDIVAAMSDPARDDDVTALALGHVPEGGTTA